MDSDKLSLKDKHFVSIERWNNFVAKKGLIYQSFASYNNNYIVFKIPPCLKHSAT